MNGWTLKVGPGFRDDHNDESIMRSVYERFQDRLNDELWMFAIITTYIRALPTNGFCLAEVWIDDDCAFTDENGRRHNSHGFIIPDDPDDQHHIATWLANYDGAYDVKRL